MEKENRSLVTEFILLGLTDNQNLEVPLFVFFLLVYIITVIGNTFIVALIRISPQLNTPMYFLLAHLSFVDLCYSSIITPNMLANFLSSKKTISIPACIVQFSLFACIGSAEVFLLTAMAYDRYVAICNPLLYAVVMTNLICKYLVAASYIVATGHAVMHAITIFKLTFCDPMVTHFFCDGPPLLKLSCTDTRINNLLVIFVTGGLVLGSLFCILVSYGKIVSAILKIKSTQGRLRAFSTCSSHFVCVTLLFGTLIFIYIRPDSTSSMEQDRVASVFYTMVIPMLNPLIYSLRNKDVKEALRKLTQRKLLGR